MPTIVTRHVELDAGHRVPDHDSKCRNPHGHRYRVEVSVTGDVIDERGNAQDGMVLDFGKLALALAVVVHDPVDHGFLVAEYDTEMLNALDSLTYAKIILLDFPPTAERLAAWWGAALAKELAPAGIAIHEVVVWETAKCSARWRP